MAGVEIRSGSSLLGAFLALAAFRALPGGEPEKPALESRPLGVPPGTRSEYSIKVTRWPAGDESQGGQVEERSALVLRPAGAQSKQAAILFKGESGPGSTAPLVFVTVTAAGKVKIGQRPLGQEVEFEVADLLWRSLEAPRFEPGTKWTSVEKLWGDSLFQGLIEHSIDRPPAPPGALLISSLKIGDRTRLVPFVKLNMAVTEWSRELVVDEKSGRPLSARLRRAVEFQGEGDLKNTMRWAIEVQETSHRALKAEEIASLPAEFVELQKVTSKADELRQGSSEGGFLSWLLGKKDGGASDPLALLDLYEKSFPQGALRPSVEPLRGFIEIEKRRQADEKEARAKAAALIGKPAPDFTLKDLAGQEVSLSQFRGKVVLLSFWGYG
jgi:hypothetical protein